MIAEELEPAGRVGGGELVEEQPSEQAPATAPSALYLSGMFRPFYFAMKPPD